VTGATTGCGATGVTGVTGAATGCRATGGKSVGGAAGERAAPHVSQNF
jgi:hypothetical protein